MSSPSEKAPWPSPTQAPDLNPTNSQPPSHRRSLKRRKPYDVTPDTTDITARQVADWPEIQRAGRQCQINAGNEILSCFPTANTVIPQDQWAAFVWNSRHPEFTQTNRVNIYLFHGDSRRQILAERNVINPTGRSGEFTAQVDDRWWGDRGSAWNGANLTYPFYWVITRSDKGLDGTEIPQTMFNAVQTTYASSVAASMSSTAAQSSSTGNSASRTDSGITSATGATGNVQPDGDSAGFPHWAIAVIVVLGFLAIASSCILAFFILRRVRRRKEAANSNRNSMGSSSPMMANAGRPETPLLAPGLDRQSSIGHRNVPSVVSPDGASTISRSASVGDGPFSGADAAIMADAFRQALRKPDFGGRPVEEGESPDAIEKAAKAELLNKELAEEGRDIRSVSSSRGVRVESIASHDTVQDHRH